jgi:hypothetical protein
LANDRTLHAPIPICQIDADNPSLSRSRRQRTSSGAILKKNQRDAILRLLIVARGAWVPLPAIAACARFWGPRIHELRQLGFRIQSKGLGETDSWFRLEPTSGKNSSGDANPDADLNSPAVTPAFPEFWNLTADGRYPD